jgi:hypothetical protein
MYQVALNKERDSVTLYREDFDSDGVMHPDVIGHYSIPSWMALISLCVIVGL